MPEGEVKTYIKDAVLNRYSKDKRSVDNDLLTAWVSEAYREDMSPIATTNDITVFKSCQSNIVLVLSKGTHVKWETALRKILLYVGATPNLRESNLSLRKMIVIPTAGVPIPAGEDELLRRALSEVGIDLLIK